MRIFEETRLKSKFDVKDLGLVQHCLGLEFTQNNNEIEMSQKAYTAEILERFGMEDFKPAVTPLEPGTKLVRSEQDSKEDLHLYPFRELIGAFLCQLWKGALDSRKENLELSPRNN